MASSGDLRNTVSVTAHFGASQGLRGLATGQREAVDKDAVDTLRDGCFASRDGRSLYLRERGSLARVIQAVAVELED